MEHDEIAPITEVTKKRDISLTGIIKLVGITIAAHLMHAKIFDYPMTVMLEDDHEEDISERLNIVGEILMPNNLKESGTKLKSVIKSEFNVDDYKDELIIDSHRNIMQIPWDGKIRFEEDSLKKALEIFNSKEQVKLLQRDIKSFIKKAEGVKNIMDKNDKISKGDLIKKVSKELRIPKLSKQDLIVINEYIDQRLS